MLYPIPPSVATRLSADLLNVEIVLCLMRGVLIPDPAAAPALASQVERITPLLSELQRDLDAHLASISVTAMSEWSLRLEQARARVDAMYAAIERPKIGVEEFGSRLDHNTDRAGSVVAGVIDGFSEQN